MATVATGVTGVTGVTGLILLVHAVVVVALALTTSTTTFLALKQPVSLPIVVGGLAALVWWIRRQYQSRPMQPARHQAAGPAGPARADGATRTHAVKEEASPCPPSQSPEQT